VSQAGGDQVGMGVNETRQHSLPLEINHFPCRLEFFGEVYGEADLPDAFPLQDECIGGGEVWVQSDNRSPGKGEGPSGGHSGSRLVLSGDQRTPTVWPTLTIEASESGVSFCSRTITWGPLFSLTKYWVSLPTKTISSTIPGA